MEGNTEISAPITYSNPGYTENTMPTISPSAPLNPATVSATSAVPQPAAAKSESWGVGDFFENAAFGALDSVLSGLSTVGLVRPTVEAGLKLAASGNDSTWYRAMADHAGTMLEAEYAERGERKTYAERVKEYLAEAKVGGPFTAGLNEKTAFHNATFVRELEEVGDARFGGGNKVEFLVDGPQSFEKRAELIDNAKESIHLLTWTIYNDATGQDLAQRLVKRAAEGLDVRVILDRNIAARDSHVETLDYMEKNGVKIIRFEEPEHVQWGNHCKMMVVDGVHAVAGGMNPGDIYSHAWKVNPDYEGQKWRDTDVYTTGPSAVDQEALFVRYWNSQVEKQSLDFSPISMNRGALLARAGRPGNSKIAVVDHAPGDDKFDVYATMMKAVSGATKTIEIENAYFLTLPGMNELLYSALDRGVKVRIYTNSNKSVDEPLVSEPIMRSLPSLFEAGAEVYLKKGDTLHSKFMVVDDTFVSVGSLNLHPRSLYYDTEMAVNIIDEEAATRLREQFDSDVSAEKAIHVQSPADLEVESTWYNRFIKKFFFRHL